MEKEIKIGEKVKIGEKEYVLPFKAADGNNYDYLEDASGNTFLRVHWEDGDKLQFIAAALNDSAELEAENERLGDAAVKAQQLAFKAALQHSEFLSAAILGRYGEVAKHYAEHEKEITTENNRLSARIRALEDAFSAILALDMPESLRAEIEGILSEGKG